MTMSGRSPRGPAIPLPAAPQGPSVEVCFFSLGDRASRRLRDVGIRAGALLCVMFEF